MRSLILAAILTFTFLAPMPARAGDVPGLSLETAFKIGRRVPIGMLVDVLDTVTRSQTAEATAKLRGVVPQLKLSVYSAEIDVTVEGTDRIWRGTNTVKLSMPAEIQFTLDLEDLKPEHIKWDKARKIFKVKLPKVKIGAVAPRLEDQKIEVSESVFRPTWFRGGNATELVQQLTREHYRPRAVELAEKRMEDAQRAARDQVRDLLRRLWLDKDSGIEIVVE